LALTVQNGLSNTSLEVTMNRFASWSYASLLVLALVPACGGDDNGGTGSTAQLIATCNKVCNKEKQCLGKEASFLDCNQMCSPDKLEKPPTSTGSKVTCDYAKLRSKFEGCLSVECSELDSCMAEASSACEGGGGSESTPDAKPSSGQTGGPGTAPSPGDAPSPDDTTPPDDTTSPEDTTPPTPPGSSTPPGGSKPPGSSKPPGGGSGDCSVCAHANSCCLALLDLVGEDPSSCDGVSRDECEALPAEQQATFVDFCTQTLQGGAAAGVAECK
jgi:hypothetical protein